VRVERVVERVVERDVDDDDDAPTRRAPRFDDDAREREREREREKDARVSLERVANSLRRRRDDDDDATTTRKTTRKTGTNLKKYDALVRADDDGERPVARLRGWIDAWGAFWVRETSVDAK